MEWTKGPIDYQHDYGPDYGMDSYGDEQSYGKDNSYDKYKDSVNVKKIQCNNFNINGLEIGFPPALNGLTSEAQAENEGANGANSFERGSGSDGRSSGHDDANTKVVCIFNNGEKTPKPTVEGCVQLVSTDAGVTLVFPKELLEPFQ